MIHSSLVSYNIYRAELFSILFTKKERIKLTKKRYKTSEKIIAVLQMNTTLNRVIMASKFVHLTDAIKELKGDNKLKEALKEAYGNAVYREMKTLKETGWECENNCCGNNCCGNNCWGYNCCGGNCGNKNLTEKKEIENFINKYFFCALCNVLFNKERNSDVYTEFHYFAVVDNGYEEKDADRFFNETNHALLIDFHELREISAKNVKL